MNEEQAFAAVEKSLKVRRFEHTLRVTDEAEKLAQRFQEDVKKARLAAILHDYAKYRPVDEMRSTIVAEGLEEELLNYGDEILHAFVGSYYIEMELGIQDRDVLNAIKYHTTGRAGMTTLEKIVFIADYIEPGRTFQGVEDIRKIADSNLDKACFLALRNTISFLVQKKLPVYPATFEAYNELARNLEGGKD